MSNGESNYNILIETFLPQAL